MCCRWRDVKQCAFDNAKHRTYVDLKVSDAKSHYLLTVCLSKYFHKVSFVPNSGRVSLKHWVVGTFIDKLSSLCFQDC